MATEKFAGINTVSSDFLRVLLTLKQNIFRDLKVACLAVVKSFDAKTQEAIVTPFPLIENEATKNITCSNISSVDLSVGDIVMIIFTDRNFLQNLKQARLKQSLSFLKENSDLHSEKYGLIISSVVSATSTKLKYPTKWTSSFLGDRYLKQTLTMNDGSSLSNSVKITWTEAVQTVNNMYGKVVITKNHVGLSNVDNTSDVNKPVSNAARSAINNMGSDTLISAQSYATASSSAALSTAKAYAEQYCDNYGGAFRGLPVQRVSIGSLNTAPFVSKRITCFRIQKSTFAGYSEYALLKFTGWGYKGATTTYYSQSNVFYPSNGILYIEAMPFSFSGIKPYAVRLFQADGVLAFAGTAKTVYFYNYDGIVNIYDCYGRN